VAKSYVTSYLIHKPKDDIMKYYPPEYGQPEFNCPYCQVFSSQTWQYLDYQSSSTHFPQIKVCHCSHCKRFSIWYAEKMFVPDYSTAPPPHEDIPASVQDDYLEASSIANRSPRGASALLRLCLQKLMIELGESGKDINKDIGMLVQKGLPEEVQQALDIVRVVGNESVHPGELDIRDDSTTVMQLFELINFIVEDRITRKKKIGILYQRLPESKRQGIEARDKSI
jgi:hypothetical protein